MSLRMTEEEYADLMRRRKEGAAFGVPLRPCGPPPHCDGEARSVAVDNRRYKGDAAQARRAKYGNRRVEIDGKKFDSQHEAGAYLMLMQRVRAGELKCVLRQVPFDLPGGIRYIADFVTILPDMRIEAVIDAKSEATKKNRVYINKKKQMKACWGIEIVEV